MIDTGITAIRNITAHRFGNKHNGDELFLSKKEITLQDAYFEDKVLKFFLSSLPLQELQKFSSINDDYTENPLYNLAKELFSGMGNFQMISIQIAKLLYDASTHPQIKSGDLFIAYLRNISYHGETVNGLGIFKSENKHTFLQLHPQGEQMDVYLLEGILLEKLDKGALILQTESGDGFRVCSVDRSSRDGEADFWKKNFLNVVPCKDEFQQTKQMIELAKTFVTTQYVEEFDTVKTDQIEMLDRSRDYFKSRENFNVKEFEKEVLHQPEVIESFRSFKDQFQEEKHIELEDEFEISMPALKKHQGMFKSVLKLDKNFHVYIHGNRQLIENGVEADGRKYYKIYYQEES